MPGRGHRRRGRPRRRPLLGPAAAVVVTAALAGCGEEAPRKGGMLSVKTLIESPAVEGDVTVAGEAVPLEGVGLVISDRTGSVWVLGSRTRVDVPRLPLSQTGAARRLSPEQAGRLEAAVRRSGAARRPELTPLRIARRTAGAVYVDAGGTTP